MASLHDIPYALVALLIGSCGGAPADATLYVLALDGAPDGCLQIHAEPLREECMALSVGRVGLNDQDGLAEAWCAEIHGANWHGECYFQLSDSRLAVTAEAKVLCDQAGPYRSECQVHAFDRYARQVLDACEADDIGACHRLLMTEAAGSTGAFGAPSDMVERAMISAVIAKAGDGPFSVRQCDGYSERLCQLAYRGLLVDKAMDAGVAQPDICDQGIGFASSVAGWEADSQADVEALWERECGPEGSFEKRGRRSLQRPVESLGAPGR